MTTLDAPRLDETIAACFERIAATFPAHEAVGATAWRPTYARLNRAANGLARRVLDATHAPGERVVILMRQDAPQVAAMLAVLKAGRVVVVVNASDPPERIRQLVAHAEATLILADGAHRALAAQIAGAGVTVVVCEGDAGDEAIDNPRVAASPDDLAFLVYTSGTTGRPKGVMRTHRQVLFTCLSYTRTLGLTAHDRVALLFSLGTNAGVTVALCALTLGAAIYPFPTMEIGVAGLGRWIADHAISYLNCPGTMFRQLVGMLDDGACLASVRVLRLGSEHATSDDFAAFKRLFADDAVLVHTLAASESPQIARLVLSKADRVASGRLPVGLPFEGSEIVILDEHDCAVAPGDIGEIAVKSRFLSSGYWRNGALTAERFRDGPEGLRLYRSGDLGRINSEGMLEWIGRRDARVKVRGHQVDLLELEEVLAGLQGIDRAAACTVEHPNGKVEIVGFVQVREAGLWSSATVRRALAANLPRHAIPSTVVILDELPRAAGGKIDRDKLRQLRAAARASNPKEPPSTPTERLLADIWADLFELSEIGRQDDFFELGGDSLVAAVVSAKVHAALGILLDLRTLGDHSTLAALAQAVDERRLSGRSDETPLMAAPRDRALPLSLFQEPVWTTSQTPRGSASQLSSSVHRVVGPLDRERLRDCLSDIVRRHESLRTTFGKIDGRPIQIIHPPEPVALPFFDLADAADAEAQAVRMLKEAGTCVLDLTSKPLVRWLLIKIRANEHWLLRAAHHIITDGWSGDIFIRELALLYEARIGGQPLPQDPPLQYADFAVWQRKTMRRGVPSYDRAARWWKRSLAGAPLVLDLPFVRAVPLSRSEGEVVRWGLAPAASQRLDNLAQLESATYYMVRLAGYVAALAAVTGQRDVVVGTTVGNRQRPETHAMFGLFSNHVILRFRFDPAQSFRAWLAVVRAGVLDAANHADIPHALLRRELLRRGVLLPATDATFTVSQRRPVVRFAGLTLTELRFEQDPANYCFNLTIDESDEAHHCTAGFDAGWYDRAGVQSFVDGLARLLDEASRHPDVSMGELLALSGVRLRKPPGALRRARLLWRRLRQRRRRIAADRSLRGPK